MAKKKPEEPAHGESWLVSYCDMISLLVTFFLMMMTFSTKEKFDVKEVGVGLLKGRGGVWQNMMSIPQQHEVDPSVVDALSRDLAALGKEQADDPTSSVQDRLDGLVLNFDMSSSFTPGSAEVNAALRKNLLTLAKALQRYTHLIVVEGFTDDRFQPTPEFPTAEAMGIARARSAARIMLENSLLPPDLVQISGPGAARPRASNDTASGRTSNRRVEVRILALAKPETAFGESGPQPKER
ncbi:MAG: flagellar motor protein MotB [Planctomycetes bacterium]|nr:flagellar motor protein MotB [Planctomycetota bacterium]